MSERTKALENEAARALTLLLDTASDEPPYAANADAVVWKIMEATIAKVQENLLSETTQLRHILNAMPDETTCGAAKRLVREREGITKKYRQARDAFEEERARLHGELDDIRERVETIIAPEVITAADALIQAVREGGALIAPSNALDEAVAHLRAWPEERPGP